MGREYFVRIGGRRSARWRKCPFPRGFCQSAPSARAGGGGGQKLRTRQRAWRGGSVSAGKRHPLLNARALADRVGGSDGGDQPPARWAASVQESTNDRSDPRSGSGSG